MCKSVMSTTHTCTQVEADSQKQAKKKSKRGTDVDMENVAVEFPAGYSIVKGTFFEPFFLLYHYGHTHKDYGYGSKSHDQWSELVFTDVGGVHAFVYLHALTTLASF